MKHRKQRLFSIVCTAILIATPIIRADDWWVDSLGTGNGTDSSTPTNSVQGAIDAASAGDTIHIRGAAGRLYTDNYYLVDKAGLTLRDWEGKPIFRLDGAADNITDRVVEIVTNGVVLLNLRFEIDNDVIGASDDIVESTGTGAGGSDIVLDGCEFVMTDGFGGAWNQGYPVHIANTSATNAVVRNCLFENWDYGDGYRLVMIVIDPYYSKVIGNTFTNTSKCVSGAARYSVISSNRFLNCRNERTWPADNALTGIIAANYNALRDCEISYNIAWNDDGRETGFIAKSRSGFNGNTRIFNNTTYGVSHFVETTDVRVNEDWDPLIVNNLMIASTMTNIVADTNTAFNVGTDIEYNMWHGPVTALYDSKVVNGTLAPNYNIEAALLNVTNPTDPDFLRPDEGDTPEITEGYENGYPSFIGAIEPLAAAPKGTVVTVQ